MPSLQLRNLSKKFGEVRVIHSFTLTCPEASYLILIGPSGAGKTTLLRLIAGLEPADCGEIAFQGRSLSRLPPSKRGIGLLPQEDMLLPHLDVSGNVEVPLRIQKTPHRERDERVSRILDQMELTAFRTARLHQLSAGQRQRVALARCLVTRPSILLLDEPYTHLDPPLRISLGRLVRHIQQVEKLTIIHVTHDPEEAMALADSIAFLAHGELIQHGPPKEIVAAPQKIDVLRFMGGRSVNAVPCRYQSADRAFSLGTEGLGHRFQLPCYAMEAFERQHPAPKSGWIGSHAADWTPGDETDPAGVVVSMEHASAGLRFNIRVDGWSTIVSLEAQHHGPISSRIRFRLNNSRMIFFDSDGRLIASPPAP